MKTIVAIIFSFFIASSSFAQYYLRGEIKDEHNNPLSNVKILLHSSGYIYYSGNAGGFGITVPNPYDSITVSADGFQTFCAKLSAARYQYITLKVLYKPSTNLPANRLISFTKNLRPEDWQRWTSGAETYSSLVENEFVSAFKFPETSFAVNINKASYSNVRRFINMGGMVPPDAVRIEEMLNYFNFDYTPPIVDSNFSFNSYMSDCPWNPDNLLLFLHICAKKADIEKIPPANLVFLIDVSGSMDLPNRLPLLKSAFNLLVKNLRQKDTVSIVVYGSTVGVWLPPTSGSEKQKILKSIEELNPGGSTPGEAGIRAAYRLAKSQLVKGGNNRVILATDGDFNVGQSTDEELEGLISMYRQWGVYLTCLGVGMGNYKDSKLEVLARRGNGNFAYLDDEKEAEKVLMREFTQTIYAVATDAYLDMSFNPSIVKDYRIIGFDNKLRALADTANEIQGGEIGSGHSLVAMFELHPSNSNVEDVRPGKKGFAKAILNYRLPNDSTPRQSFYDFPYSLTAFNELPASLRFASSTVMFGSLLKKSQYMQRVSWDDAIEVANQSVDMNDPAQKEFIALLEKAKKIYAKEKKRKKVVNNLN
ncbi:MAG: von Willebrand factor type A domain-containing protein [Bacteroidetes bacterium]|nr:von Willebrand factor type A domain-containing protein [Bacteroidota bacterium]